MKIQWIAVVVVVLIQSVTACFFDIECRIGDMLDRCVNGSCDLSFGYGSECTHDLGCRSRGIYFRCKKRKCTSSDHMTCFTDDDCKKNTLNKTCVDTYCKQF